MRNLRAIAAVLVVLIGLAAAVACFISEDGFAGCLAFLLKGDTHAAVFIVLMSLLPIIGFPISLFLVLAGVKFGLAFGLVLAAVTMAVHQCVTFLVAHSMFQPYVDRFLGSNQWGTAKFSRRQKFISLILFAAIPGPPYAVKNYVLSLSGISFMHYLAIAWPVQWVTAVPLVAFGRYSLEINFTAVLVFLAILGAGYFLVNRLRRKNMLPAADKHPAKSKKKGLRD